MMGELAPDQNNLFYDFCLEQQVPANHLLRQISQVLDLGNLRQHLYSYYSHTGRPSVDPELMIRMLIVGYCYVINVGDSLLNTTIEPCKLSKMLRGIKATSRKFLN